MFRWVDSPNSVLRASIGALLTTFFVFIVSISQLRNLSGQAPQAVDDCHGAVYWVSSCHARWLVYCRFGCWNQLDLRTALLNVFVMYPALQLAGFVIRSHARSLFFISRPSTQSIEETCMRDYRIPSNRRLMSPNRYSKLFPTFIRNRSFIEISSLKT
jgi:hypothetical protein